jgi:hypothetical protein
MGAGDDPVNDSDPSGALPSAGGYGASLCYVESTTTTTPRYDNYYRADLVLTYGIWPLSTNNVTTLLDWNASQHSDTAQWWTGGNLNLSQLTH